MRKHGRMWVYSHDFEILDAHGLSVPGMDTNTFCKITPAMPGELIPPLSPRICVGDHDKSDGRLRQLGPVTCGVTGNARNAHHGLAEAWIDGDDAAVRRDQAE